MKLDNSTQLVQAKSTAMTWLWDEQGAPATWLVGDVGALVGATGDVMHNLKREQNNIR